MPTLRKQFRRIAGGARGCCRLQHPQSRKFLGCRKF